MDTKVKPEVTLSTNIELYGEQPHYIDEFSTALLENFYLKDGETPNDAIARAAEAFSFGDYELAQRIYDYAHKGWFMFASPILSNAPKGRWVKKPTAEDWENNTATQWFQGDIGRAMPISCFALYVPDTIDGQVAASSELAALSVSGGGVGLHNGIRAVSNKAPGPIPYMKTLDAVIGYFRQAESRRGVCAYYMDVDHPDIIEHIRFRIPSGGDSARKADNRSQFHNAVNITDEFIRAVMEDDDFDLRCPHTGEVRETLKARYIWEEILETRALTGEPYLFKVDTANRALPQSQKDKGLEIKGSNICNEISLVSSDERTFVCCLSSLNLEKYDEWKDTGIVGDLIEFLDNVLQYFIEQAPAGLEKSVYSATMERALGLGTMGWHYFLQKNDLPFAGGGFDSPINWTHRIFSSIKSQAVARSQMLAEQRGEPSDMKGTGLRNSHLMALAPNSNNSIILKTSPSIEPISGNAYSQTTRAGTFLVKNPYLNDVIEKHAAEFGLGQDWIDQQWASVVEASGSAQHLTYLTDHQKEVFKTAFEIDNHWIIEQGDARQQYICQSQSLNLFFPAGVDRAYFNSVHLKAANAEYIKGLYYARMERGINADVVKDIERKTLVDWKAEAETDDCLACSG